MDNNNNMTMDLMNNIPAVMYRWQVHHTTGESSLLHVSDYCEELFGISPQRVMEDSSSLVNLIVKEDVPGFSAALVQSMQNLTVFQVQVRVQRPPPDSKVLMVQYQGRPRLSRDGEATVWDGVVMEVAMPIVAAAPPASSDASPVSMEYSNVKTNQADGQEHNKAEEAHPQNPVSAVHHLVLAERGLTEWLSHEIRNPLSVTMEALQTLQELTVSDRTQRPGGSEEDNEGEGEDTGKDRGPLRHQDDPLGSSAGEDDYSVTECHQVMAESITYVVELLNNMMDLDQCAQGQMPVVTAPCQVHKDILLPTYRMMKRMRPKNRVKLRLAPSLKKTISSTTYNTASRRSSCSSRRSSCGSADEYGDSALPVDDYTGATTTAEGDIVAHVDKLRLRQVLNNLIANAFHFTTHGFVEVDLHVRNTMLSFHVRDSGCGVNPSDIETLFSRWEQLGTSRNGTGIGLCLCQAIVKAMGGDVRLNTDYNSGMEGSPGAEFIVEVPIQSTTSSETEASPICVPIKTEMKVPLVPMLPSSSLTLAVLASRPSLAEQSQPLFTKQSPSLAIPDPATTVEEALSTAPTPAPLFLKTLPYTDSIHSQQTSRTSSMSSCTTANTNTAPTHARHARTRSASIYEPSIFTSPVSIQKASYFRGKYRFLVVDDEKMGRKFLKRRFSRLFPEATAIVEVASGEEALVEASKHHYDVITMDHFMAIDEMNGDETIRELRSKLNCDALIVGISGNDKQAEHLQAGADSFFQKPLPNDTALIESLQHKLAPPADWKVLILSNDATAVTVLTDRLRRVASPHFTTQECATKRWTITSRNLTSAQETRDQLHSDAFDLVVLVESGTANDATYLQIRNHLRHLGQRENLMFVECLHSSEPMLTDDEATDGTNDILKASGPFWFLSSLPSVEAMRQSLCQSMLADRSAPTKRASAPIESIRRMCPRRQNSEGAVSA